MSNFRIQNNLVEFVGDEPTTNAQAKDISIESWKLKLNHLEQGHILFPFSTHGSVCGYCILYFAANDSCEGCPVLNETGLSGCGGTPCEGYLDEIYHGQSDIPTLIRYAQAEIEFLEALED